MIILLLLALLIYSNVRLAMKKGKNPVLWGVLTFIGFLLGLMVLGTMYMQMVYTGGLTRPEMEAYFLREPLSATMICMLGVGGSLIIRLILERSKGSDVA